MGKLQATFNSDDLTSLIDIVSVKRSTALTSKLNIETIVNKRGGRITGITSDAYTIAMEFRIKYDTVNKRRQIAGMLSVDEPKQLIFSDEPEKYYNAFPESIDISEISYGATGSLNWVIADGLSHAVNPSTFVATTNADGVLEAEIINDGTAPVAINYEITNNADNGYIGIVSSEGAMEFGSREELDTESYQESDTLKVSSTFADWPSSTEPNAQNPVHIKMNGALAEKDFAGKNGLYLSDAGTGDNWHGGGRTLALPADSQGVVGADKLYCYFNHVFMASSPTQTGIFMLSFMDAEDKMVCSYYVYKSNPTNAFATAIFEVGGTAPHRWKSFDFYVDGKTENNQFTDAAGSSNMQKLGETFSFYWRNLPIGSVDVPELKDVKVTKVQYFLGQFGNRSLSDADYMGYNYLRNISLTKLNVDKTADVPNRYMSGDTMLIDGDNQTMTVKGMSGLDDEIIGTNYFLAPVGTSKVQLMTSTWCTTPPDVKIKIRKAWL